MRGAIPSLSQYAFMAWSSLEAQGQLYFTSCLDPVVCSTNLKYRG